MIDHPRFGGTATVNPVGMTNLSTEVRSLLGRRVDVETMAGTLHGTLLSCTSKSLWIVDGDDDLVVPLTSVEAIHPPAA